MTAELAGRTALVTGAGRGIGRGVALRFAAAGSRVVALDVDAAGAAETAAMIGEAAGDAVAIAADVSDAEAVARAFAEARARVGFIDTLVNVAGVWAGGSVTEISIDEWDRTMSVNVRGVFLTCREAIGEMVDQKRGVIINVASTAAFTGTRRAGAYNASKAAVVALTRNLALDYAAKGIRSVAICPGLIEGEMELQLRQFRGDTEEYRRQLLMSHPLGRLGTPEDVADAAVFLTSDRAGWMTGSCLFVDGGRSAL